MHEQSLCEEQKKMADPVAMMAAMTAAAAAERRLAWEDLPDKCTVTVCLCPDGQGGFLFEECILVRRTESGWELVTELPEEVCGPCLFNDYGTWKDKEVTQGHLLWKKVIREKDGLIQEDEVTPFTHLLQKEPRCVQTPSGHMAEALVTFATLARDAENLMLTLELTKPEHW